MKELEKNIKKDTKDVSEEIILNKESVAEFLKFLERKEEYLDNGLGAFHTDDHSNW
ncbi:hypothetical protein [Fusobacterium pseudoperiodonticum]|jgi:hypothetical protein|uniref:hypothetical protein n=1 Tax=Fusobacterium pseudoperiodonticum TaxID=2663009 RepID=UPI001293A19A|nr:hypothetical protein [Fusobacterium pseudoperiodonticum]